MEKKRNRYSLSKENRDEIRYFTNMDHIWWGALSIAGQRRYDNRFKLFKKFCKPNSKTRILEVGAGDGEFTRRLVNLHSKIIATDITPKVVERGKVSFKKDNIKDVVFEVGNVENISYSNKTFDVVCGISVLTHTDFKKSMKEIFRVLKDDGQIFFSEPNLLNPIIYSGLNNNYLRKRMEFSPRETGFVRWDVRNTLKKIGFRKVKVVNYDFLHPKTPRPMLKVVEEISNILEKTPLIKEISGSLIIWAKK